MNNGELVETDHPHNRRTLFIDPVNDTATVVADQGIFAGYDDPEEAVNDVIRQMAEGKAAKDELAVLKPVLAFALSKLPKKQLRVRAEDMDTIADAYAMQSKSDGQGGIILRSVKIL